MVKSIENGTSLPPFLVKCYEIVDDDSTNELISWSESSDSFIIWDDSKFSSQLLSKYFKHSNFSSFVRQLNIYGFRKTDTDRWEFANEAFVKGQKHLLKSITRRKQPQGVVQRKSCQKTSQLNELDNSLASEEDKIVELWKEVENLKTDKNALMQELKKLRQHQQTSHGKLVLLREQLKGMEKNQQQMLSFIVMAMQNPGFLVQLLQPKENNWRMPESGKNKLSEVTDDCKPAPSDGMIVRYQPPTDGDLVPACTTPFLNSEDVMEFDFSTDEMRDLLEDVDLLSGPLDGKHPPYENHGQLILPDISGDDYMLEQLLSSPSIENVQAAELDEDNNECQNKNMETSDFQSLLDNSESMEVLTKQMGILSSEGSQRY
ncbi:heat stress transcription factor A-8 [Olea europaea subsp. europaea]|uniref:Heat stress transcription factor A-8 n=1 Tax=Olea europaea subsp. europaea TaxID=158383 RepID=A0A8S0UUR9_OLEEU|nr:heat stress transcription factor A-8 [Olea europaea subsp. europaea]